MNTCETIRLKLVLTDELRTLFDDQSVIERESAHNVTLMNFNEYEELILDKTTITKKLIYLLFEQYSEFEKHKDKLVISTFRTSIMTPCGLNGETNFHRDNILFSDRHDRNLIITWGPGSDAISYKDSVTFNEIRETFVAHSMQNIVDYSATEHIWKPEKYIERNCINVLSSHTPDKDGNLDCLIMSGKEVYHRRTPHDSSLDNKYWRYVLNIYFDSSDF